MNEIKLFENSEFGRVRVVMRGEDPWFVAKDVCECLAIRVDNAMVSLDDDEKYLLSGEQFAQEQGQSQSSCTPYIIGGQENSGSPTTATLFPSGINVVSESGLYSLILRSRKPEAKAFKRWVTHEVLPQIRKSGMYMPDFNDPAKAARAWADEYERRRAAEAEKQKAQAALVQEQSAHATTYRRYEAQNQQLVQAATLCHSLANTLGVGCNFKSCIAQKAELVKWFYVDRPDYYGDNFYSIMGKFMSKLSRGLVPFHPKKYRIQPVPDAKYNGYGAYQIEAWEDFFAILRAGQFDLLFPSLRKRLKGYEG